MKKLILNLKKKILIIDLPPKAYDPKIDKFDDYFHFNCQLSKNVSTGFALFFKDFGGRKKYPVEIKYLCTGAEINEAKLKELDIIQTKQYGSPPHFCTLDYRHEILKKGFNPGFCAFDGKQFSRSFSSALQKHGYGWNISPEIEIEKTFTNPVIFEIIEQ